MTGNDRATNSPEGTFHVDDGRLLCSSCIVLVDHLCMFLVDKHLACLCLSGNKPGSEATQPETRPEPPTAPQPPTEHQPPAAHQPPTERQPPAAPQPATIQSGSTIREDTWSDHDKIAAEISKQFPDVPTSKVHHYSSAWEEIAQTFPKRNMKGLKWKETERSLITVGWEVKVYPTAKKPPFSGRYTSREQDSIAFCVGNTKLETCRTKI